MLNGEQFGASETFLKVCPKSRPPRFFDLTVHGNCPGGPILMGVHSMLYGDQFGASETYLG